MPYSVIAVSSNGHVPSSRNLVTLPYLTMPSGLYRRLYWAAKVLTFCTSLASAHSMTTVCPGSISLIAEVLNSFFVYVFIPYIIFIYIIIRKDGINCLHLPLLTHNGAKRRFCFVCRKGSATCPGLPVSLRVQSYIYLFIYANKIGRNLQFNWKF